jgi:HSP20 family protein
MALTRWSPVRGLAALEVDRLNRMFEAAFAGEPLAGNAWVPAVDIFETKEKDVVVKVELPEMKREDIKVAFENDVLTIEGERASQKDVASEQYHRIERGYGAFRRSFSMPVSVDAARVSAAYVDGVLTITLPRREETGRDRFRSAASTDGDAEARSAEKERAREPGIPAAGPFVFVRPKAQAQDQEPEHDAPFTRSWY